MAELFRLSFPTDLSEFDVTSGAIAWNSGNGYGGTSGRVLNPMTDTTADFGYKNITALSGTHFHVAGWFDPGTLTGSTAGQSFRILSCLDLPSGLRVGLEILISGTGTGLRLIHKCVEDDDTVNSEQHDLISTTPFAWEIRVTRATNSTSFDGKSELYLIGGDYDANGELVGSNEVGLTNLDNYDYFATIDRIRYGATNIGTGISGNWYFDECVANDADTWIFVNPLVAPIVSVPATATPKYGSGRTISSISVTQGTGAITQADLTCEAGMTITVVASGSANVTGNTTAAVQVTGTQTDVLATIASVDVNKTRPDTATWFSSNTLTVQVTDDEALTSQGVVAITWEPSAGVGTDSWRFTGTSAQVRAAIAAIGWTPDTAGAATLEMYSVTSAPLSDQDTFNFTVSAAGGISVSDILINKRRRRRNL